MDASKIIGAIILGVFILMSVIIITNPSYAEAGWALATGILTTLGLLCIIGIIAFVIIVVVALILIFWS